MTTPFLVKPLTSIDSTEYDDRVPAKSGTGFDDPNRLQAHKRPFRNDGAFFLSVNPDMAACAGALSGAPGSCSLGSSTLRSPSPDFDESRDGVNTSKLQETVMSNISILNYEIRILDGLYNLNDLHKASGGENKHRPSYWLQNKQTQDLAKEIEIDGKPSILKKQRLGTFVSKELVCDYASWINAKFHLKVIRTFLSEQEKQPTPNLPTEPQSALTEWDIISKAQDEEGVAIYTAILKDWSVRVMHITDPKHQRSINKPKPGFYINILDAVRSAGYIRPVVEARKMIINGKSLWFEYGAFDSGHGTNVQTFGTKRFFEGYDIYTLSQEVMGHLSQQKHYQAANVARWLTHSIIPALKRTVEAEQLPSQTAQPTPSISDNPSPPDCRMMMVIAGGQVRETVVLPKNGFACDLDGFIALVKDEYFNNDNLIRLNKAVASKIAQRLTNTAPKLVK